MDDLQQYFEAIYKGLVDVGENFKTIDTELTAIDLKIQQEYPPDIELCNTSTIATDTLKLAWNRIAKFQKTELHELKKAVENE